jgi:methanethiol S-methyltransferase
MPSPRSATLVALLCAWLGGAVFVASLVYFGYMYAIRLDGTVGPTSAVQIAAACAWDVGLFAAFAVHHSVLARAGAKRWLERWIPPELERSTYVWTASLLFVTVCWFWEPVGAPDLYRVTGPLVWLNRLVQAAGVALLARASFQLDWLDLAGIRQVLGARRPAALIVDGPYRLVRHPIYLGWTMFVLGASHMTATRLVFAGVSLAYLVLAVPIEERSLRALFGQDYRTYENQVRWRIVPFVY